jgi:hypothetical protein
MNKKWVRNQQGFTPYGTWYISSIWEYRIRECESGRYLLVRVWGAPERERGRYVYVRVWGHLNVRAGDTCMCECEWHLNVRAGDTPLWECGGHLDVREGGTCLWECEGHLNVRAADTCMWECEGHLNTRAGDSACESVGAPECESRVYWNVRVWGIREWSVDCRMWKIRQLSAVDKTDGSYLRTGDLVPNRLDSAEKIWLTSASR